MTNFKVITLMQQVWFLVRLLNYIKKAVFALAIMQVRFDAN